MRQKTINKLTISNRRCVLLFLFMTLFSFQCCKKAETDTGNEPVTNTAAKGIYVLNEGLINMNNSTLSYYDFSSGNLTQDIFLQVNNRGLGDTGNDLQCYGAKLYCVLNVSERLEIMDKKTTKSIKAIALTGKQPRKIAFYKDKAYVSCFDGSILKIDTASLTIEASLQAGSNPEGLCVANGKLYVANSGGLNYPNYGHTVSVIDLSQFIAINNIEVALNPCTIAADCQEEVYLVSKGNYGTIPYTFQRIDSQIDEVVQVYDFPVLNFTISGENAYLYYYDFSTEQSWVKVMNILSETITKEHFITDGTLLTTPYGVNINPLNGDVYITDALDFTTTGDVYCFDKNGKKKFRFEAGINPSNIVFIQ